MNDDFSRCFFTFCTVLYFETYRLSDCYYFLPSYYRNIVYRTGEFEKISDYLMSDQVLNISEYRLSDSQKTVGSQLCILHGSTHVFKSSCIRAGGQTDEQKRVAIHSTIHNTERVCTNCTLYKI